MMANNLRPQFGNRYLTETSNIFEHNAWDDVEWDEEQESEARKKVEAHSKIVLTQDQIEKYESNAAGFWDEFYVVHLNGFFKDRHWLFTEFPELAIGDLERRTIFEIGCGVGNTIIPILKHSPSPHLKVYGCDFSAKAINILKESPDYDAQRSEVFVLDATSDNWDTPFEEGSVDIVILIFVLSAINPEKFTHVIEKINKCLKPGGVVLFRDYGLYDMAQLRFKTGKALGTNFYVRGDGTRVYFFSQDEIRRLFEHHNFVEQENRVDRRLQINRGRQLKMYRVWIQAKYCKT